jgi:Ser/Thr protein kinase RdoA (MazF antagonist)
MDWLIARRDTVPCLRPSPIHWDFHPGNILLGDDGSAKVIDWTQLAISDARFDLAWTLLLIGAYEGSRWREPILREYERLAGAKVEGLEYFDVYACLKRLFSIIISVKEGAEKLGMRPGAEATMKQQAGAIRRTRDLLLERSGIIVPEVEELLVSLA